MQRTHFGKYEVVELIGKGGFGQVFKGMDPDLKRPVAIKTCSLEEGDMRERFFKEAEIAARLQHPSITTVYDFGKVDGEPYLVQEYLSGEDLDQKIKRQDPIGLEDKLRFLLQIADGLQYAHSRGVVHRDVKPANMRILEDGQVRIMDFGIARLVDETQRLTQTGMTIGTAGFLSPEQLQGLEGDGRSDIFSFGVLAYELLTYVAPFQAESISALFYAIAYSDPPPVEEVWPECPPALATCLNRCLEKDRDNRYQDFSQAMDDLGAVLADLGAGAATGPGMAAAVVAAAGTGAAAVGASGGSRDEGGTEAGADAGEGAGAGPEAAAGVGSKTDADSAIRDAEARRRRGKLILGGFGVLTLLIVALVVVAVVALPSALPARSFSLSRGEGFVENLEKLFTPLVEFAGGFFTRDAAPDPTEGVEFAVPPEAEDDELLAGMPEAVPATEADDPRSMTEAEASRPATTTDAQAPLPVTEPAAVQPPTEAMATPPPAERPQAVAPTPTHEQPAPPAPAVEAERPYRGTATLVLLWSEGGDPTSAITAENSFLEELSRRGMAVVEAGLLRGIHEDATALAMARGLDAGAVAGLGRQYGAEVVVVGSLRTEWEPSVGQFFTGRAVLDLRAYSVSASELLRSSTQQVGTGGTPGKLGSTPLAAETEAAKEVGRLAAVEVERELGALLPRR